MLVLVNMSEPASLTTTNPKIIEFFKNNQLFNFENFILHYINEFSSKKPSKIELTIDELMGLHQEYQNILNCKRAFDHIAKEIKTNNYKIKCQTIENLFSKHLNIKQEVFTCDNCNRFTCTTKKGLQTHRRKCIRLDEEFNRSIEEEDEDDEDIDDN